MGYKKYRPIRPPKPRYVNNLISQGKSREELEVFNMIRLEFPNLKVYESDRVILHGRELDIWIPSLKIGIEYNGLFYHNSSTKSESYHLWKTVQCEKQGIRLIQIFSDEWENKKALVIDTIKKVLGKYSTISANDTEVLEISKKEAKDFLDINSLNGFTISDIYIGLLYENSLVSVIGVDIISEGVLEITQYADRMKIKVSNGLHRMISYLKNKFTDISNIYLLIDRRLQSIDDIEDVDFEIIEATEPRTFYTKDFKSKRLLENFRGKTEEQLTSNGYVKINDSGLIRLKIIY